MKKDFFSFGRGNRSVDQAHNVRDGSFAKRKSLSRCCKCIALAILVTGCPMLETDDGDDPVLTGVPIELAFDDGSALISGSTENLTVDRSEGQTLTITAAAGLTDHRWSLGGGEIPAPRGTAESITIEAVNYPAGSYLLGLSAKKGGVDYSTVVTFTVEE